MDGLVPDCSNSSALAMEVLQSCTKPSIYELYHSLALKPHQVEILPNGIQGHTYLFDMVDTMAADDLVMQGIIQTP